MFPIGSFPNDNIFYNYSILYNHHIYMNAIKIENISIRIIPRVAFLLPYLSLVHPSCSFPHLNPLPTASLFSIFYNFVICDWYVHVIFFVSLLKWWVILTDFLKLNKPLIFGINLTWSGWIYFYILLISICQYFIKAFCIYIFMRYIGL